MRFIVGDSFISPEMKFLPSIVLLPLEITNLSMNSSDIINKSPELPRRESLDD